MASPSGPTAACDGAGTHHRSTGTAAEKRPGHTGYRLARKAFGHRRGHQSSSGQRQATAIPHFRRSAENLRIGRARRALLANPGAPVAPRGVPRMGQGRRLSPQQVPRLQVVGLGHGFGRAAGRFLVRALVPVPPGGSAPRSGALGGPGGCQEGVQGKPEGNPAALGRGSPRVSPATGTECSFPLSRLPAQRFCRSRSRPRPRGPLGVGARSGTEEADHRRWSSQAGGTTGAPAGRTMAARRTGWVCGGCACGVRGWRWLRWGPLLLLAGPRGEGLPAEGRPQGLGWVVGDGLVGTPVRFCRPTELVAGGGRSRVWFHGG